LVAPLKRRKVKGTEMPSEEGEQKKIYEKDGDKKLEEKEHWTAFRSARHSR